MFTDVDEDSSHFKRILVLVYVMMSLSLCGGTVFGFAGLKAVLLDEGVYDELCISETTPCNDQMLRLDLMFTMAASLFSVYLLPAGLLLNKVGPRYSFILGFLLVVAGCVLFVLADSKQFDVYIPAFMLIGTGNPVLYISAFNFSKLYPSVANVILSFIIGFFGFSAIVFYFFQEAHFRLGMSSNNMFAIFGTCPVLLSAMAFCMLPRNVYHVQRQNKLEAMARDGDVTTNSEATEQTVLLTKNHHEESPSLDTKEQGHKVLTYEKDTVPVKERSYAQQLRTPQFLAQTLFFSYGMLHLNFYLATVYDQLLFFDETGGETADRIIQTFAFVYPVGCLISIVPVGTLVKNTPVSTSLFVYCIVYVIFSALSLVPDVEMQWATVHMFIIVRVAFFTVMSTYSAYVFGFKHLATMFGASGCVAGLVSLFSYNLSYLALSMFDDFTVVNVALLIGACLCLLFPLAIRLRWEDE